MKIFFDNCLPPRIAKAIKDLDESVEVFHLREIFDEDVEDIEWIRKLGEQGGWVIITRDQIYRLAHQKEVLKKAGLVSFFLKKGWTHLKLMEQAKKLIGIWDKIKETASASQPGDCYDVPVTGAKMIRFRLE